MSYSSLVRFEDSSSLDAFSRLRVSQPDLVYDCQFTYDLQPLLAEAVTINAGATVTHDTTNRVALMSFAASATGSLAMLQTYEHFRYQPGRSQLVFITFNFNSPAANCLKFAGYSDSVNGIELRQLGSEVSIDLLSGTGSGNFSIPQSKWNIDPMNGGGDSRIRMDWTKTHILVIDFQALYVGRVRVGFDINGIIYYVHQFLHANVLTTPYIQSANLPIRVGMRTSGTVTTTMNYICSAVLSEGGSQGLFGYGFSIEGQATAASGARTHILSIRPKTTFNSIENRSKIVLDSVELIATGNQSVFWELCIGQAISGTTTYNNVNGTYSATEFNTAGTISGSPAIVLDSGYIGASAQSKTGISSVVTMRYPITLDYLGAVRPLGTLSLIITGIGGTSDTRASFNWREIR